MTTQVPVATSTCADLNTRALAYLRIAVGILFLIFAEYKVFGTQFTLGGGAALDHLVLALCFAAFAISAVGEVLTVRPWLRQLRRRAA